MAKPQDGHFFKAHHHHESEGADLPDVRKSSRGTRQRFGTFAKRGGKFHNVNQLLNSH